MTGTVVNLINEYAGELTWPIHYLRKELELKRKCGWVSAKGVVQYSSALDLTSINLSKETNDLELGRGSNDVVIVASTITTV